MVIVNGENSGPRGRGITSRIAKNFIHNGADVITTGNHIWAEREIYQYLNQNNHIIRPANFPSGTPGKGATIITTLTGHSVGVINVQGRVFMRESLSCPFMAVDSLLSYLKERAQVVLVDFHAEATSEKYGMGHYLDGRVSAVFGTHTHVQTADEQILPKGTAYISDLGMVGALDSMLGMKKEPIIDHFITQMPTKFSVELTGPFVLSGVLITVDATTGKAEKIERVRILDDSENPTGAI